MGHPRDTAVRWKPVDRDPPVLIVGAGPAGLATAAELTRRRIPYRLFERGPALGTSWENAYESLTLHTGRHMSALPGRGYPRGTPLFPTRRDFLAYLHDYARAFDLRVERGIAVSEARRDTTEWVVRANGAEWRGRALVMTTGIMSKPIEPPLPGRERFRGEIMHSVAYRRPDALAGKRVLVVGVGNSGAEIATELGHAGAQVTILIRSGANVVPLTILGVPIQYVVHGMRHFPRALRLKIAANVQRMSELRRGALPFPRPPWSALDAIPLIGFHLVDAIRAGLVRVQLGALAELTEDGARFADGAGEPFDAVILATGFVPALDALGDRVRRDERGFAIRTDRVTSADLPGLYFVGHNYDPRGAIANIAMDAGLVARRLADDAA